jgi:hypothetical protein
MAVVLAEYVPSLRREVEPPGATLYDWSDPGTWVGYLTDAFWEARLDGFLKDWYVYEEVANDPEAEVRPLVVGGPDLGREGIALMVLYAGIKVLRNRILNTNTSFKAKAGPVEFEQQSSATMLAEMLKQLKSTKDQILEALDESETTAVMLIDAYSTRVFQPSSYYGAPELSG